MQTDNNLIVEMKNITKSFFGNKANDNVSFTLKKGEIHALLGENGTGKTTLMNILTGVYEPDSGDIFYKGKKLRYSYPGQALELGIGMVHQRFSLIGNLSVLENIILGNPKNSIYLNTKKITQELSKYAEEYKFQVDLDAIVDKLPIGIKQKTEILKMLVRNVDVLIVDEPTTVLTKQETDNLLVNLKKIAESGKSVVFISHKMKVVRRIADRITVLRRGKFIGTVTPNEVTPEELSMMMVGKQSGTLLERKVIKEQEKILSVEGLHVRSDKNLLAVDSLSFELNTGEILGIAGVSGNGQTELCEAIIGTREIRDGKIWFKDKVINKVSVKDKITMGISYIPSDRINVGVAGQRATWENIGMKIYRYKKYNNTFGLNRKMMKEYADEIVKKYDIIQPGIEFPSLLLSGGNLQKVIIGREIEAESDLYICEYPTRGLDVGATEFVRNTILELRNSGKAVILISGDLDEIFMLADRISVMHSGHFVSVFPNGKYDVTEIGLMMSGTLEHELEVNKGSKNV